MLAAAAEKQEAQTATIELTKRFVDEKAAFEADVTARADALVEQYKRVADEASRKAKDAVAALHAAKHAAMRVEKRERTEFQEAVTKRCQLLVRCNRDAGTLS